jgi:hypothetical protein
MVTLFRIAAAGVAALLLFTAIVIAVALHVHPLALAGFMLASVVAVLVNSLNFVNLDGLE